MSQQYVGEIRAVGFNFAPQGWAICDGSLLQIAENDVLFNLLGTTYGGDGQTTFRLPDLRGHVPIHQGTTSSGYSYVLGQMGGAETVNISVQQMATHTHLVSCQTTANVTGNPNGAYFAPVDNPVYAQGASGYVAMSSPVGSAGGSAAHDNMTPYLVVNYIISLYGIYPSPS